MTNAELTNYIKHYINKDRTKSAIMLTGKWGVGKSYYIQNELVPSIQADGEVKCIIVSLYGIKTTAEISKSIYFELRAILRAENEVASTVKAISKTVLRGITSYLGIDLNLSEEERQKLYESIDLSNKFVILEDIERSQIDLLELLGYINNLVEQDDAKILLVVNEDEIIEYEPIKEDTIEKQDVAELLDKINNHKNRKFTETTRRYLAVKEKTVSDTILFEGNFKTAILQIINSYSYLSKFKNDEIVNEICEIMRMYENYNLRSFIFACQKSNDVIEQMDKLDKKDFIKYIFLGIVCFSFKLKAGEKMVWDGSENYSISLGSEKFPLFKFCFDYIVNHKLDISQMHAAEEALAKKQLYDQKKTREDRDLIILFNYYINYEKDVEKAVESISNRLSNMEDISFYDYGEIAVYLVIVKHKLGFKVEKAKEMLVNNLRGRGNELNIEEVFHTTIDNKDISIWKEYEDLRNKMVNALKEDIQIIPGFKYLSEQANMFSEYVLENEGLFNMIGSFTKNINLSKLANMFSKCSPSEKQSIRKAFFTVYRYSNSGQFFASDLNDIEELRDIIKRDAEKEKDKVQKLQYEWFIENLNEIVEKLS